MKITIMPAVTGGVVVQIDASAADVVDVLGSIADRIEDRVSGPSLFDLVDAMPQPSPFMSSQDDGDEETISPTSPAPRFNVGDLAEVASKSHWHPYDIGTKVEIHESRDEDGDYYVCALDDTFKRFVREDDLAPIAPAPSSFYMTEEEARAFAPIFGATSREQDKALGIADEAGMALYRRVQFADEFPLALTETEAKIVLAFLAPRSWNEEAECLWRMYDRFADNLPSGYLAFLDELDAAQDGTGPLIGAAE